MKIQLKFFALGFVAACILGLGGMFVFLFSGVDHTMRVFHDQGLPSGKSIKVTMCNLVWGSEHDERLPDKDCFALEYVSSGPNSNLQVRNRETVEAFELLRPISELWGFNKAEIYVFPSTERKGPYDIYYFKRNFDGKWTFDQHPAKVFAND